MLCDYYTTVILEIVLNKNSETPLRFMCECDVFHSAFQLLSFPLSYFGLSDNFGVVLIGQWIEFLRSGNPIHVSQSSFPCRSLL